MSGNCMHLGNCIHLGGCVELGDIISGSTDPNDCIFFKEVLAFLAEHDLTLGELLEAMAICANLETITDNAELLGITFGKILKMIDLCASINSELSMETRVYLEAMAEEQTSTTVRAIKSKTGATVKKPEYRKAKTVKKTGRRVKRS